MAGGNATSKTNIRRWKKRVTELLDEAFDEGSRDAAVHGVVSDHLALATTEEARGILQKSKHKWKELVPPEFIQDICHEVSASLAMLLRSVLFYKYVLLPSYAGPVRVQRRD